MATNTRKLASLLGASGAGIANDGTLTSAAIGEVIVAGDIAAGAVDTAELADDAVETVKIANDQITGAKIENNPTIAGNLTVSGDLVPSTPLSHRNIFINGAMTIAQRGTSESSVTSTRYAKACDRMKIIMSSGGGWTISQESSGPAGFSNSYKVLSTEYETLDSRRVYIDSSFEGQDLQHLKKGTAGALATTLSFWVRSTTTGTFIVQLHDHDNNRTISKPYTISVADTWEYKTITFAGDTTGAFGNDNNKSLSIYFWLVAGTDYTSGTLNTSWNTAVNANRAVGQTDIVATKDWWITGIQWEVGSNATPFEHRSWNDEAIRCYRYCYLYGRGGADRAIGRVDGTSNCNVGFEIPVSMRAIPTASTKDGDSWYLRIYNGKPNQGGKVDTQNEAISSIDVDSLPYGNCIYFVVGGGTGFTDDRFVAVRVVSSDIVFSAEL